jgi:hypothetical protein
MNAPIGLEPGRLCSRLWWLIARSRPRTLPGTGKACKPRSKVKLSSQGPTNGPVKSDAAHWEPQAMHRTDDNLELARMLLMFEENEDLAQ